MPDPDIYTLAQQLASASARQDAAALRRIAEAYSRMYKRLAAQVEALAVQIGGKPMTTGQLARLERYKELMDQIDGELNDFASYAKVELSSTAEQALLRASRDARNLVTAEASGAGVTVAFNTLPRDTVIRLLGFLDDNGVLFSRMKQMPGVVAEEMRKAIIDGVGLGLNPREIVRRLRIPAGQGLTDALRMTRTAQLYAYRETTRANYLANPDVVMGWYWMAALGSPRTCMSCVRMHGTFHKSTERLNDHHNGRCTMLPAVKGFPNPLKQTGEQWFNQQSEADQRQLMGRDYYAAYKDGKFKFENISTEYDNDVYGLMRRTQTLENLLGVKQ